MGAMLQMARKATGGPEETATALEALIRNFNDPTKRKLLTDSGIKLMDPEDPKRMRSIIDISKDLIKLTNADVSKIGRAIDSEGLRALNAMIIEFKQTGGFKSIDEFLNTSSDPQALLDDSKEVAQTFNSAMTSLRTAFMYFANTNLAGPIQTLADALNSLDPETLQQILSYGGTALGGLAAVWAGSKVIGMGATALSALKMYGGGKKIRSWRCLGRIGRTCRHVKPAAGLCRQWFWRRTASGQQQPQTSGQSRQCCGKYRLCCGRRPFGLACQMGRTARRSRSCRRRRLSGL